MQSVLPTARARASVCVGEATKEMGSTASSFLQMVWAESFSSLLLQNVYISVTLRGYSSPESSQLEHLSAVKDIEFVTDLGPEILQYYEISNFGPFDVGNVIVSQSLTQSRV